MARRHEYLPLMQEATAKIRKAQQDHADTLKEGRSPEWGVRRRQEILAEAQSEKDNIITAIRKTWVAQRLELEQVRPKFENWTERTYAATAAAQDLAGMTDGPSILNYYRNAAATVSPHFRQELDRLARSRLAQVGDGSLSEFEQVRADFLSPEEGAFEAGQRELDVLGDTVNAMGEWIELAVQEIRRTGETKIDPAAIFTQYTEVK